MQGFCPSEDKCTNQSFSKKQYGKVEVVSGTGQGLLPLSTAAGWYRCRQPVHWDAAAGRLLGHHATGRVVLMVSVKWIAGMYMCMLVTCLTQSRVAACTPCSMQRRAGRKGFGLFALEDIKQGQFVIEYIGEFPASLGALPADGHT